MRSNRTLMIVVAALVVVAGAALAAVLLAGTDDSESETISDDPAATVANPTTTVEGTEILENRPVTVTGTPLPPLEDPESDPAVAMATPVVDGAGFDGTAMTVGGSTETPTMYVFLAHWCPHCNDEIPELIELSESGGIPDDLAVVGISTAVASDRDNYPPSQWIVDKGWPWPVMADDEAATSFIVMGGSGFPYSVIADADGSVLARAAGSRPASDIQEWIEASLG